MLDAVAAPSDSTVSGLNLSAAATVQGERRVQATQERWVRGGDNRTSFSYGDRVELGWTERLAAGFGGEMDFGDGVSAYLRQASRLPQPSVMNHGLRDAPPLLARPSAPPPRPHAETCSSKEDLTENSCGTSPERLASMIIQRLFGIEAGEAIDTSAWSGESAAQTAQEILASYVGRATISENGRWLDAGVRREVRVEDRVELNATLTARQDDGKGHVTEQRVDVKLSVSRSFLASSEERIQIGKRKDPLVLDLTGEGINLTGVENGAVLDLNADGALDRMATVSGGTALVWMDRDGRGTLDSGRELFGDFDGAADGFASLAALDANGDGVIDARDEHFGDLMLRTYENGAPRDHSLAQAGVASLSLAHVALPAGLGESARLESVGVFTRTDGSLGVLADAQLAYVPAAKPS